jgi:hypothetical protein
MVTLVDVLVSVSTIPSDEVWHVGSSPTSPNDAGVFPPRLEVPSVVVQSSSSVKIVA